MSLKRILSAMLACSIVATMSLTGCSGGSQPTSSGISAVSNSSKGEPTEIIQTFLTLGQTPRDLQLVQDAVNKITVEKINVKVKFLPISYPDYSQKINLMLTSGEQVDIALTTSILPTNLYTLQNQGLLQKLDSLYDKYGADIKKIEGVALSAGKIGNT